MRNPGDFLVKVPFVGPAQKLTRRKVCLFGLICRLGKTPKPWEFGEGLGSCKGILFDVHLRFVYISKEVYQDCLLLVQGNHQYSMKSSEGFCLMS